MASITFTAGTVIPSTWLNDVNAIVYGSASPPANPIRVDASGLVGIGLASTGARLHLRRDSTVASESDAGLRIDTGLAAGDVGVLFGVNKSSGIGYIQTVEPSTTYSSKKLVLQPNGGDVNFISNALMVGGGGLGYCTGSGGTVTQATSKSTTVVLNKTNGQITMNAASLAGGATVAFQLTNSSITSSDVVILNPSTNTANYQCWVAGVLSGACSIVVKNVTGGTLAEAVVINFAVIKAVAA